MDSRRGMLKKLLAGTAATAAVPASASATVAALERTAGEAGLTLPSGPAPWWLLDPVRKGSDVGFGWYVAGLSAVSKGAAVLTLSHRSGGSARVHLCLHGGKPQGIASTRMLDIVLMDGGSGSFRTDERLGRVVLGLAERIRRNELDPNGDLWPLARMMTHDDRVDAFGPENL